LQAFEFAGVPALKTSQSGRIRRNSLLISLLAGNLGVETSSNPTASTARLQNISLVPGVLLAGLRIGRHFRAFSLWRLQRELAGDEFFRGFGSQLPGCLDFGFWRYGRLRRNRRNAAGTGGREIENVGKPGLSTPFKSSIIGGWGNARPVMQNI
jgi:hypothetical protein